MSHTKKHYKKTGMSYLPYFIDILVIYIDMYVIHMKYICIYIINLVTMLARQYKQIVIFSMEVQWKLFKQINRKCAINSQLFKQHVFARTLFYAIFIPQSYIEHNKILSTQKGFLLHRYGRPPLYVTTRC